MQHSFYTYVYEYVNKATHRKKQTLETTVSGLSHLAGNP